MLELPPGGVTNDMMQNANAMIVLDDYSNNNNNGRGGGGDISNSNDSILINEHNPFNTDHRLRRNGAVSTGNNFVTPPDRIRHDPLRILMQQLQNDENGFPPDHENIHNALMNASQGDVASFLLGGGGGGSGVGIIEGVSVGMGGDFHFTSNANPGLGGRMGSVRPLEAHGHGQGQGQGQGDLSNAIRYVYESISMINYILSFLLTIIAAVIVITTVIIVSIIIKTMTIIIIITIVVIIIIIVITIVIIVITTSNIIIIDFCLNYKLNRITNVPFYLSLSLSLFLPSSLFASLPLCFCLCEHAPSLHTYQSTCSDLLPGGVDRALQHGGHGVHHPLLSLSDDSSPSTRRPSGTYEYLLTVHGALSLLFLSRKLNFDSILDDF